MSVCSCGSCTQDRKAGTVECYIMLGLVEFDVSDNIRNIVYRKKSNFVRTIKKSDLSKRKKPLHENIKCHLDVF